MVRCSDRVTERSESHLNMGTPSRLLWKLFEPGFRMREHSSFGFVCSRSTCQMPAALVAVFDANGETARLRIFNEDMERMRPTPSNAKKRSCRSRMRFMIDFDKSAWQLLADTHCSELTDRII